MYPNLQYNDFASRDWLLHILFFSSWNVSASNLALIANQGAQSRSDHEAILSASRNSVIKLWNSLQYVIVGEAVSTANPLPEQDQKQSARHL